MVPFPISLSVVDQLRIHLPRTHVVNVHPDCVSMFPQSATHVFGDSLMEPRVAQHDVLIGYYSTRQTRRGVCDSFLFVSTLQNLEGALGLFGPGGVGTGSQSP